ncbi:MAG TPA: hypothetical protein VGM05_04285 [Planctomycetaceae bacterium]|jgi:hypothetical protein
MILTQEQRTIVERGGNVPITLDGIPCIVVREDVFESVRNVIGTELGHDELRALLARSTEGSDWTTDPSMDIYDEYDKQK